MAKTASINIRTEPETKANAEALFSAFGITISDAINMFLNQSLMVGGLPFELKQPRYNAATEQAMAEARAIAGGVIPTETYTSAKEMLEALE